MMWRNRAHGVHRQDELRKGDAGSEGRLAGLTMRMPLSTMASCHSGQQAGCAFFFVKEGSKPCVSTLASSMR